MVRRLSGIKIIFLSLLFIYSCDIHPETQRNFDSDQQVVTDKNINTVYNWLKLIQLDSLAWRIYQSGIRSRHISLGIFPGNNYLKFIF